MTDAGFKVEEGVHQGAVPSGYLYTLGQNRAMQNHCERVEAEGGGVTVILDDNTTLALREVIFTLAKQLAEDLALVGLELQPAKSKAFITEHLRKEYDTIINLLDPGIWSHPDILTRQMLWILIHVCMQFTGDYWLRHWSLLHRRVCK